MKAKQPRIPGYELLQRLGGGMLTSVYSAREVVTDFPCAVKVLRPDWDDQPTAIKLLQREARAGLSVKHNHLVQVRYAHVTKPPYFLVMEMLPGESLRQRLQREYCVPVQETLWIVRQTAEALAALHRGGFMHGDVKPDNIRLVGKGNAMLLDLGFAHRPGENASIMQQGYILGTVDYLAPELCTGAGRDDFSSDMFSLGVVMFEMLTGQLPFPPSGVEETLRRRAHDHAADIRQCCPRLHPCVADLVDVLLANEPAERLRAQALINELVPLEIASLQRRRVA